MATRLWRWLLGFEAALAAALGIMLWVLIPVSGQLAGVITLTLACSAPAILVASSFLASLLLSRRSLRLADVAYLLRALLTEIVNFYIALLAITTMPRAACRLASIDTEVRDRPLLLIHGIVCNQSVWKAWLERLRAAGFGPIRLLDLEPPLADIEVHAARVERELRAMQQESSGRRVDIIAHSMGGLVARAALRRSGQGVIGRLITLGSPHNGTRLARLFPWRPLRQMRPDSDWLRALNCVQESVSEVSLTSIYSLEDNLIVPARSSVLQHAAHIELRGIGHLGLLSSHRVIACALAALETG